jgi:hypothetical protein
MNAREKNDFCFWFKLKLMKGKVVHYGGNENIWMFFPYTLLINIVAIHFLEWKQPSCLALTLA